MSSYSKIACMLALGLSAASWAQAQVRSPIPAFTPYIQQCTVCHNAYPPGMLSASAWQQLVADMPAHFGGSVMVNVDTQQEISDWLQQNAGTFAPAATQDPPQHRITRSDWWQNIHRNSKKIPATFWKTPMRLSASNCSACHAQAALGEFDSKTAKVPK